MDVGLLLIRAVLGALFVGHGTQKLFSWFRGHGLDGTGRFVETLGYRPGRLHAALAGLGEAGGGALLVLGFLTPLGAAALIAVMINVIVVVHWPNGLWNTEGGMEYPLVAATAAACLAFTGAGVVSLDRALGLDLAGAAWGFAALVTGVLVAGLVLAVRESVLLEVESDVEEDDDVVWGDADATTSEAEVVDR